VLRAASPTALRAANQLPHTAVTTLADGQLPSLKRRSASPPRRRACVRDQSYEDGSVPNRERHSRIARVRATGTHEGELMGTPATGRSVDVQLIDIMRFDEDGLVAEQWGVVDMLAMMQQLGAAGVSTPA
jgi:hypothetical protein